VRSRRSSSTLLKVVLAVAMALWLEPGAFAKPRFKVLAGFPNGGLWSGLTFDAKGNLYGVTTGGGDNGVGSIFEMTRDAKGQWTVTTLHSFNGKDGATPNGDLIFDAAGNLYGTTPSGGAYYGGGTVFELTPGSGGWMFNVLHSFCHELGCPDGGGPKDGLALDRHGNLLGTAQAGLYDMGVVFELTPGSQGWSYSVLYNFGSRSQDASAPFDAPVLDGNGNIYGTTDSGGKDNLGTVFELRRGRGGPKERLLWQFDSKDGSNPEGSVVLDTKGNIYGCANSIFELARKASGGWKEVVLYDFSNRNDGFLPISGPVLGKGGTLYGTTALGGIGSCYNGCGVVYQLAPRAGGKWKYIVLHRFNGSDGFVPNGRLVLDPKGNLYGTAFTAVFEVTP
jgi:hypothetical protein